MLAAASPIEDTGSANLRWLRGGDLNPRPLGYEPNELPDCSTPRQALHWRTFGVRRSTQSNTRTACHASLRAFVPPWLAAGSRRRISDPVRISPIDTRCASVNGPIIRTFTRMNSIAKRIEPARIR